MSRNHYTYTHKCIQHARTTNSPLGKFYLSAIAADFFTKFILFTQEDSRHIYSKFHYNKSYGTMCHIRSGKNSSLRCRTEGVSVVMAVAASSMTTWANHIHGFML